MAERINVDPDAPCVIANRIAARLRRDELFPFAKAGGNQAIEAMADELHSYFLEGTLGAPQTSRPSPPKKAGYVVTLRDDHGRVAERLEFDNTPESLSDFAIGILASLPEEQAIRSAGRAAIMRRDDLQPELIEALNIPRGTIAPVCPPPEADSPGAVAPRSGKEAPRG